MVGDVEEVGTVHVPVAQLVATVHRRHLRFDRERGVGEAVTDGQPATEAVEGPPDDRDPEVGHSEAELRVHRLEAVGARGDG